MGLLTKPADFTATTLSVSDLNAVKNRVYDEFGTTANGQGNITDINVAAAAAVQPSKVADTAFVLGNTVNPGVQTVTRPSVFSGEGTLKTGMGTGSATPTVGGVLHSNFVSVGNVGAGTDDLMSYTLPANTLTTTGRGLRITAWGTAANNANAKTLTPNFGSSTTGSVALTTSQAHVWRSEIVIFRTALNTQRGFYQLRYTDGAGNNAFSVTRNVAIAETETAAITIKYTGTAVADNDIVQEGFLVEAL